jgi:hypothetical protein
MLSEGAMAVVDNPFVSHRSGAMDNLKLKSSEWSVNHEYVLEEPGVDSEEALLASLSKADRTLLSKYTRKLSATSAEGVSKHKKHKKKKHKKKSKH